LCFIFGVYGECVAFYLVDSEVDVVSVDGGERKSEHKNKIPYNNVGFSLRVHADLLAVHNGITARL
jgi:hypothetical protein